MIAHVGGVPVEELIPLAYGGAAMWTALRVMAGRRFRRLR